VNPIAAQLGRMAAGKPKGFSAAERRRRAKRLEAVRYRGGRKKGAKNKGG
jgi:hypothetical protein